MSLFDVAVTFLDSGLCQLCRCCVTPGSRSEVSLVPTPPCPVERSSDEVDDVVVFNVSGNGDDEAVWTVMGLVVLPHVVTADGSDCFRSSADRFAQRCVTENSGSECFVDCIER